MIDIFSLSVEEMTSQIKGGQLTSIEVCEKYIERINKFEKDVKAWAHFDKSFYLKKLRKPINIEDQVSQQVHYTVYPLL